MKKRIALTILPPFWPNLPPLSLVYPGAYLLGKDIDVPLRDYNNRFFLAADDTLKNEWKKSVNIAFERQMLEMVEDEFRGLWQECLRELLSFEIVGFSCHRSNFALTLKAAKIIKQKNPRIKIVFGGPEITGQYLQGNGDYEKLLREYTDVLVAGEGERPLLETVLGENEKNAYAFYELPELAGYDFPAAYQQFDLSSYPRKKSISLFVSRGCVRQCRFCSERLLYKQFRTRRVEDVLAEIRFYKEKLGVEYFIFHDSMLNADLKFLEGLCEGIIREFGHINWEAQIGVRPDMPDRLLSKMKQSGCYNLFIGLESGSAFVLKRMNKGFDPADAEVFFRRMKAAGLFFGVSLIVGFGGESDTETNETLDFLIRNKDIIPKIEQINPYVYYPGNDPQLEFGEERRTELAERTERAITHLKSAGFKMTNAFLNNLVTQISTDKKEE